MASLQLVRKLNPARNSLAYCRFQDSSTFTTTRTTNQQSTPSLSITGQSFLKNHSDPPLTGTSRCFLQTSLIGARVCRFVSSLPPVVENNDSFSIQRPDSQQQQSRLVQILRSPPLDGNAPPFAIKRSGEWVVNCIHTARRMEQGEVWKPPSGTKCIVSRDSNVVNSRVPSLMCLFYSNQLATFNVNLFILSL